MRRLLSLWVLLFVTIAWAPGKAHAIQGCTLRNPDRDIRRMFPDSTDYRSSFISIKDRGGEETKKILAERLGDKLDPVYEAIDIPFAYYQVLKGQKTVGYVFGINQKGRYGGMQLILATDPGGRIREFYYQKLSSPERKAFVRKTFTDQFKGLTLADFYYHQGYRKLGLKLAEDKVGAIKRPADTETARQDFASTLRGVMKDLILFDLFWQNDKNADVFSKVQDIVKKKGGGR